MFWQETNLKLNFHIRPPYSDAHFLDALFETLGADLQKTTGARHEHYSWVLNIQNTIQSYVKDFQIISFSEGLGLHCFLLITNNCPTFAIT